MPDQVRHDGIDDEIILLCAHFEQPPTGQLSIIHFKACDKLNSALLRAPSAVNPVIFLSVKFFAQSCAFLSIPDGNHALKDDFVKSRSARRITNSITNRSHRQYTINQLFIMALFKIFRQLHHPKKLIISDSLSIVIHNQIIPLIIPSQINFAGPCPNKKK